MVLRAGECSGQVGRMLPEGDARRLRGARQRFGKRLYDALAELLDERGSARAHVGAIPRRIRGDVSRGVLRVVQLWIELHGERQLCAR